MAEKDWSLRVKDWSCWIQLNISLLFILDKRVASRTGDIDTKTSFALHGFKCYQQIDLFPQRTELVKLYSDFVLPFSHIKPK